MKTVTCPHCERVFTSRVEFLYVPFHTDPATSAGCVGGGIKVD